MIKLRKSGSLVRCSADWHRYKNYYSFERPFYLDSDFWREIEEYESFDYGTIGKAPEGDLEEWMENNPAVQRMRRLISRARNSLIWQFNAVLEPIKVGFPEQNTYTRQVAFFANRTIQKVSKFDEFVLFPYTKLKIFFLNLGVTIHNNIVWFNALGQADAIKAMERGEIVGSLDIGARKVLYKKQNDQLMEKWPFYEGIESTDAGKWKPVEKFNTWVVEFEIVKEG